MAFMLSSHAFARFEVDLQGFDFNYSNPKGSGTASAFSRQMEKADTSVNVDVEKVTDGLAVVVTGAEEQSFVVKELPSFVKDAKSMLIEQLFLNVSDTFSITLDDGSFVSEKDELSMENFSLDCNRDEAQKDLMDQAISGCVSNLNLHASKFSMDSAKKILQKVFQGSDKATPVSIRSLDFASKNGNYELKADVKAQISGTARSSGKLSYDPASKVLTIKISEVKFGVLSVRGMVFDQLKRNESASLKVNEPYLYLKIK
jgi:hypothetical protein